MNTVGRDGAARHTQTETPDLGPVAIAIFFVDRE